MGSADICQDRWDTSAHVAGDVLRVSRRDEGYKPYHEVQAVFAGDPVRSLMDLFLHRWEHATGEVLTHHNLVEHTEDLFSGLAVTLPMPRADVAFSRTVPAALNRAWSLVNDVRDAAQNDRLKSVAGDAGCHACHTHTTCSERCPKGIEPTAGISGLKRLTARAAIRGELD